MTPRIIALTGRMGSGKSEVANILVALYGYKRMKYASALKNMLRCIGLGDREIEGDLKEKPCPFLMGQTPRHAMITLGTEWGRDMIHRDFWVNVLMMQIDMIDRDITVVIDDCRFPNEAGAVIARGGEIWRIVRDAPTSQHEHHASESGQDALPISRTLLNDGTLDDLANLVYRTMKGY